MGWIELALNKLGIQITKRIGGRIWAHCPKSTDPERHPKGDVHESWFIRPDGERQGQHHCFSCKYSGDLVTLVQEVLHLQYGSAKAWLAEIESAEAIPLGKVTVEVVHRVRDAFTIPEGVEFGRELENWPTVPRRYAQSRRMLPEQVSRWGIGYSIFGRLGGRLVLPVRDSEDRIVNYAARTFVNDSKRYLAADRKDSPNLSVLFGESAWGNLEERNTQIVVVTEGILNALAFERAMPGFAVAALCGSDIRSMHLSKLARFGRVIVATDPDPAGDKAAEQLLFGLSRYTRAVRLRLPEGTDADTVEGDHGAGKLREALWAAFRQS